MKTKRTNLRWGWLVILSLILTGINNRAENVCPETGPFYGPWVCDLPGSGSGGSLNVNALNACAGQTIVPPGLFTDPTIGNGSMRRQITYSCPVHANSWETTWLRYTADSLRFSPLLPTQVNTPGATTYTGYVDVKPTSLLAWWPGENATTEVVYNGNGTLVNGATYAAGKVGNGFNLNGISSYVSVPNSPYLNIGTGNDFSFECWIQALSGSSASMAILDKRGTMMGRFQGYYLLLSGGKPYFSLYSSTSIASGLASASADLRDSNFHHIAVTVTRNSATGLRIYVDGVLKNTFSTISGNGDLYNLNALRLGSTYNGSLYFKGVIDEPSLYGCALSASDIASFYNAGTTGNGKCLSGGPSGCATIPQNTSICAGASVPVGSVTLTVADCGVPYRASGYKYKILNRAAVVAGDSANFFSTSFNDSSFLTGQASFGTLDVGGCADNNASLVKTVWPAATSQNQSDTTTDLLLRRHFYVPPGTTELNLGLEIDNGAQIYINGNLITSAAQIFVVGNLTPTANALKTYSSLTDPPYPLLSTGEVWHTHEYCATEDSLFLKGIPKGIAPGVWWEGDNLLAIRARDWGSSTFADVRISFGGVGNQPPTVALLPTPMTYTAGAAGTLLGPASTVVDSDSPNFDTGTLIVNFWPSAQAGDQLAIQSEPAGVGKIHVSGSSISYETATGTSVIGTLSPNSSGNGFVVTFNDHSSVAAVQELMRTITFNNTLANPSTAARTVRAMLKDGDGGASIWATMTVNVNTAIVPLTVNAGPDQTVMLTDHANLSGSIIGGFLPVTTDGWSKITGPGTVSFTPNAASATPQAAFSQPGFYQLQFTAHDYSGRSVADVVQVHVLQNLPPVVDAGPDRQIAPGGTAHLSGSAHDDGIPSGSLNYAWTVTGPVSVTVPSLADTSVVLNTPGLYKFILRATEAGAGLQHGEDEMEVVVADPASRTFTDNIDFEQGMLMNVNYDDNPNALTLNKKVVPLPFINVVSDRSDGQTRAGLCRIDTRNGRIVGEYRAGTVLNSYRQLAGSVVDKLGNVYVAGGYGTIMKFGIVEGGTRVNADRTPNPMGQYLAPPFKYNTCVDRDHDGLIKTSTGVGDWLPWEMVSDDPNDLLGRLEDAEDEAAISYVVPRNSDGDLMEQCILFMVVDENNDLIVGVENIDVNDCNFIEVRDGISLGTKRTLIASCELGSGGPSDFFIQKGNAFLRHGFLWVPVFKAGGIKLLKLDTGTPSMASQFLDQPAGKLAWDPVEDRPWIIKIEDSWDGPFGDGYFSIPKPVICKLDLAGNTIGTFSIPSKFSDNDYGTVSDFSFDGRGSIWLLNNISSSSRATSLARMRTDGSYIGEIPMDCFGIDVFDWNPHSYVNSVIFDCQNRPWIAGGIYSANMFRVNPDIGSAGEQGSPIGAVDLHSSIGNDGHLNTLWDPIGNQAYNAGEPSGVWSVIHDGKSPSIPWGTVCWNATVPTGASLVVEVRSANQITELPAQTFVTVASSGAAVSPTITGQYLEIRVTFKANASLASPVLNDLTVSPTGQACVATAHHNKIAFDDGATLDKNGSISISVLANDKVPAGTSLSVASVSSAHSGNAILKADGTIEYSPFKDFYGLDRFIYTVVDGQGASEQALVTVEVLNREPADAYHPTAVNDTFIINGMVHGNNGGTVLDVLQNDLSPAPDGPDDADTDPDEDTKAIRTFTQPSHGKVEMLTGCVQALRYTPSPGWSGPDSFTYTIENSRGLADVGKVDLNVRSPGAGAACDAVLSGTLVPEDAVPSGNGVGSVSGTADTYEIHLEEGKEVTLTLTLTSSGSASVTLTDTAGKVVSWGSSSYNVNVTGDYTVEVMHYEPTATDGYTVTISCADQPSVAIEAVEGVSPSETTTYVPVNGTYYLGTFYTGATTPVTRKVRVSNHSNGTTDQAVLTVYSVGLSGSGFNDFQPVLPTVFPATINPGRYLDFSYTFQASPPSSTESALLTVVNNDPDNNPYQNQSSYSINLTADGVDFVPPAASISLTAPTDVSAGPSVPISAMVSKPADATIENVTFNDLRTPSSPLEIISLTQAPFSFSWPGLAQGDYRVEATADIRLSDNNLLTVHSKPMQFKVGPSNRNNHPPVAFSDVFTVRANSDVNLMNEYDLPVMANDQDQDVGDVLTLTDEFTHLTKLARIRRVGNVLKYTPSLNAVTGGAPPSSAEEDSEPLIGIQQYTGSDGGDHLSYTIKDSKGATAQGKVTVYVVAAVPPTVAFTLPAPEQIFNSSLVPLSVTATPDDVAARPIQKVEFFSDEIKIGESTSADATFSFAWSKASKGEHWLTAIATDSDGVRGYAAPRRITVNRPGNVPPTAAITDPIVTIYNSGPRAVDPAARIEYPTIRDGRLVITGTANDQETPGAVAYRMLLYRPDGSLVAAVTPGPTDADGYHAGVVDNSVFPPIDLSICPNGTYDLELRVWDGVEESTATLRITLDSALKIGQFTFSQEDLQIGGMGLPLSVIRTYDSYNLTSGDFGYGWTYAIHDLNVQFDEDRSNFEDYFDGEPFSLRVGGGRDVTLTLPDGRRTTFSYNMKSVSYDGSTPGYEAYWDAEPGVTATLTTLNPGQPSHGGNDGTAGDNSILSYPWPYWAKTDVGVGIENYDFPGFKLTLEDGTVYEIVREDLDLRAAEIEPGHFIWPHPYGKATLSKITEPDGNVITIAGDKITKRNPSGAAVSAVVFHRDTQGRITDVYDPLSLNPAGIPIGLSVVQYTYDSKGNLTQVSNLKDRATGSYETTSFKYEKSGFPHYITEIIDPRGISPIINEYDNSGRLSAVTDIKGKRTEFIHETTAPVGGFKSPYAIGREITREEPIADRSQFKDSVNEYDSRGNVVASYTRIDPALSPLLVGPIVKRKYNTPEAYPDALSVWDTYLNDQNQTVPAYNNLLREETLVLDHTATPQIKRTTHVRSYHQGGKIQTETVTSYPVEQNGTSIDPTSQPIVTVMDFGTDGQLLASTDGKGYITANEYDATTRVLLRTKHFATRAAWLTGTGGALLMENNYDGQNRLDWSKDALFNKTVNIYFGATTADGRVGDLQAVETYEYQSPSGYSVRPQSRVEYTYDINGNRKTETHFKDYSLNLSPSPITTQFNYDAMNRLTDTIEPLNGVSKTIYGASGRVDSNQDKYGAQTLNTYNNLGELFQVEAPNHAITGTVTTNDVSGQRQVISERAHFAGDPVYGTRTTYDKLGRAILTEQLENLVIDLVPQGSAYDAFYRSSTVIAGSTTQTHYDDSGRVDYTRDAKNYQTDVGYDAQGRRYTTNFVNGKYITAMSEYDANGNQTASYTMTCTPAGGGRTCSALGDRTDYEYDEYNRQTKVIYPATAKQGGGTERLTRITTYDLLGRRVEEINQEGISTKNEYDGLGRLTAVVNAYKTYNMTVTPIVVTDANPADQTIARYKYDDLGNLIEQTDANQTILTVANQKHTTFEYDDLGRRTKRTLPEGQFELYSYDPIPGGQPFPIHQTTRQDFNAVSRKATVFDFDLNGRLSKKTPDASFVAPADQFTYTATGQRATMDDAVGTTTYQYNNREQLWKKITPVGTLTYTYDENGNLTGIASSNPSGVNLTYQSDVRNRLSTVNSAGDGANTVYNYDDFGNLQNFIYPDGISTGYKYDYAHRLTDISVETSGLTPVTLATFNYNPSDRLLGKVGQRRVSVENIKNASGLSRVNRRVEYDYDVLYRLTKENITASESGGTHQGPIVYDATPGYVDTDGYDRVGNRRKRAVDTALTGVASKLPTRTYGYDRNDWLTSQSGGVATSYDANGNTLRGELTPGISGDDQLVDTLPAHDDTYDFENRLTGRTSASGIFNIVYDGDGNRVKKVIKDTGGTVTKVIFYLVSEQNPTGYAQVMEEFETTTTAIPTEASRNLTRKYAYGHDLLFQERKSGASWLRDYYGYDGHGNVRFLFGSGTEGGVTVSDTYTYDAFGTLIEDWHLSGTTPNNYLYCGEQWDGDLGMYFLRARYLNPTTGRFWTMDTFDGNEEDPLNLHKYLYAQANPVNGIDPSGNMTLSEAITTTFTIANLAARTYTAFKIGYIIGTGIRFTFDDDMTLDELTDMVRKEAIDAGEAYLGVKAGGFIFGKLIGPLSRKLTPIIWSRCHQLGNAAEAYIGSKYCMSKNLKNIGGAIPDFIERNAIREIKNWKNISVSGSFKKQMLTLVRFAKSEGKPLIYHVRPSTGGTSALETALEKQFGPGTKGRLWDIVKDIPDEMHIN